MGKFMKNSKFNINYKFSFYLLLLVVIVYIVYSYINKNKIENYVNTFNESVPSLSLSSVTFGVVSESEPILGTNASLTGSNIMAINANQKLNFPNAPAYLPENTTTSKNETGSLFPGQGATGGVFQGKGSTNGEFKGQGKGLNK